MTNPTQVKADVEALREALEDGPTGGQWKRRGHNDVMVGTRRLCAVNSAALLSIGADVVRSTVNADYIVAAQPDRIRRILSALESSNRELTELRTLLGLDAGVSVVDAVRGMRALLKRSSDHINAWARQYGQNDPSWLPPAGSVELLEDIDAALSAAKPTL